MKDQNGKRISAGKQIWDEMKRLGTQGQMELANALFNGSAFVPYGPGQYPPKQEKQQANTVQEQNQVQQENEGLGM